MCICPQNIQISPLATKILRWRHGQLQNSTEFLYEPDFPFLLPVFHTWPSKSCLRVEPLRAVFDILSKSSTSRFPLPVGREGEWNSRYCTRTKSIDPLLTLQSRCEPRRFRSNAMTMGRDRTYTHYHYRDTFDGLRMRHRHGGSSHGGLQHGAVSASSQHHPWQ